MKHRRFRDIWFHLTRMAHHPTFHRGHHAALGVVCALDIAERGISLHGGIIAVVLACELFASLGGEG